MLATSLDNIIVVLASSYWPALLLACPDFVSINMLITSHTYNDYIGPPPPSRPLFKKATDLSSLWYSVLIVRICEEPPDSFFIYYSKLQTVLLLKDFIGMWTLRSLIFVISCLHLGAGIISDHTRQLISILIKETQGMKLCK